jgi:hypothetical protein
MTYLVVLFLAVGVMPLAFTRDGAYASEGVLSARAVLVIIPVLVALYIARTATVVVPAGIQVRALLGSRQIGWSKVRGLSVNGRSVYVVCVDGTIRLPCVKVSDLAAVARASGGRLPEVAEAPVKAAPTRRRRG